MTNKRHALTALLAALPSPQPEPTPTAHAPTRETLRAVALREVLSLLPEHLAQLPLATTLLLTCAEHALVCTSGRLMHAELLAAEVPVITARGLCVLADAAEQGRSSRDDLLCWLQRGEPLLGATPIEVVAYGGSYGRETVSRKYTVAEVLGLWGLTLRGVIVGDGTNSEVLV